MIRCSLPGRPATPRLLAVMALAVVASVFGSPASASADDSADVLVLSSTADGGLAWAAGPDDSIALAIGLASELGWNLSGLDASRHRSDLARIHLDHVDGPGRFVATTTSPFRSPELLLDHAAGHDDFVLQVGRRGTMQWAFDQPGNYRVTLTATLPRADGGPATATITYELTVADEPAGAPPDVMAGAAALVEAAPRQAGALRAVIDRGHVDMGPRIVDGVWRVQLRDDSASPVAWRELADVVLHVRDAARIEVPSGDAYAFLGAPGARVYVLPQVQQADLVWPGWNTQDPSVLAAVPGATTWRLRDVDGPGRFVLYLTGTFGRTETLFDTANGLLQDLTIDRNTHVHGNWAFTEPGVYRLAVEMTATDANGSALSDTRTLTVAVGDSTDPNTAFTPGAGMPGASTPSSTAVSGSSTTTTPAGGAGSSTTSTAPTAAGGGGGPIVKTGVAHLGPTLGIGGGCVAAGGLLLLVRRRTRPAADPC